LGCSPPPPFPPPVPSSLQAEEAAQLRQLVERAERRAAHAGGELATAQRQCAALEARLASLKVPPI